MHKMLRETTSVSIPVWRKNTTKHHQIKETSGLSVLARITSLPVLVLVVSCLCALFCRQNVLFFAIPPIDIQMRVDLFLSIDFSFLFSPPETLVLPPTLPPPFRMIAFGPFCQFNLKPNTVCRHYPVQLYYPILC